MFFLGILIAILNFILGVFVILKNKSLTNLVFGLFAISAGVWILSIFFTLHTDATLLWGRMAFFSSVLGIGFIFLFTLIFPGKRRLSKLTVFSILLIPIIIGFSSFTDLMIKSVAVENNSINGVFGPLIFIHRIFIPVYIIGAIFLLFKKYHSATSVFQKLQLKYTIVGITLFLVPVMLMNAILPLWFSVYQFNSLGPLFSIFMVSFIAYAIVRYRLMDIRVVIQRGIIYAVLLTLIVGFYLATVFVLGFAIQQATDIAILFSAAITAVVGIFSVPPIERYFRKSTDKIFFKDKYDYSTVIDELSEILNKNLDIDQIIGDISETLERVFKVGRVGFLLVPQNTLFYDHGTLKKAEDYYSEEIIAGLENSKELIVHSEIPYMLKDEDIGKGYRRTLVKVGRHGRRHKTEVTIPIVFEGNMVGVLVMGKKLSGDMYTGEDLQLLKTLSYQAAIALEKAKLYEEVKKSAHELEKRVKQRTEKIQQLQEDRQRMMIDISHELQTPLTVVKGELGLLKQQMPDNKKLGLFEKSIDEISKFIYDLLYLALLETKQERFKKEPVNLSNMVKDLAEYFKVLAQEKNITFIADTKPNIVVSGDKDKLEELITNLVNNSVKYMRKQGKREISIVLRKKKGVVQLIVRDTGIGISKKDLPRIFDRFYRAKNSKRLTKGTGLGLTICKEIVARHGGTITAKSTLGKGTAFTVVLKTRKTRKKTPSKKHRGGSKHP